MYHMCAAHLIAVVVLKNSNVQGQTLRHVLCKIKNSQPASLLIDEKLQVKVEI